MAELIERQTAIKAAEHAYNEWNLAMAAADGQRQINRCFKMQELCKAVASVFENAPAADVAPVRHGQWISWEDVGNYVPSPNRHECSVCHDTAQVLVNNIELLSNYCPNCGAMMDGDDDAKKWRFEARQLPDVKITLVKRVKYAGDVHSALVALGWDLDTAAAFLDRIPDAK